MTGIQKNKITHLLDSNPETDRATIDCIAIALHVPVCEIVFNGDINGRVRKGRCR